MLVGEICTRKVIVASRRTSIYEAARLMREHHTGDVVVTDDFDGRRIPVGIVTDRDIVVEVLAQELNPAGLTLGEVMTATLVTAKEADGVFETIRLMRAEAVRRLPIVDSGGSLVGIVSLDDVVELMAEELGDLATLIRQEQRKEVQVRA